jgi:hypothetical protein
VFRSVHKASMQSPIKIGLVGKSRCLDSADSIDHSARTNGQASPSQRTRKMGNIAGQFWVFGQLEWDVFDHSDLTRDYPQPPNSLGSFGAKPCITLALTWLWPDQECVWLRSHEALQCRLGISKLRPMYRKSLAGLGRSHPAPTSISPNQLFRQHLVS